MSLEAWGATPHVKRLRYQQGLSLLGARLMLRALLVSSHCDFLTTLLGTSYDCPHFSDEETHPERLADLPNAGRW